MMFTSAEAVRYSRSTDRASASSSTIATRRRDEGVSVIGQAGHRQLDTVARVIGAGVEPGIGTEHGDQPLADVLEADAPARRSRRFSIARVFDGNRQAAVTPRDIEPNDTALEQAGDAVRHRVLDERL